MKHARPAETLRETQVCGRLRGSAVYVPCILVQKPSGGGFRLLRDKRGGKLRKLPPVPSELPGGYPWQGGWSRERHQVVASEHRIGLVTSLDLGDGAHPGDEDRYGSVVWPPEAKLSFDRGGFSYGVPSGSLPD